MHLKLTLLVLGTLASVQSALISNRNVQSTRIPLPNQVQMDPAGNYLLGWEFNQTTHTIIFQIIAKTTGFVGFGISPDGTMHGADIFIGGVNSNGTPYYSDRFGTGRLTPKLDQHQDWQLLDADESDGVTYLKFSRQVNSTDEEDYPITDAMNNIIWSIGNTDDIEYHSTNRGSRYINLLQSPSSAFDGA